MDNAKRQSKLADYDQAAAIDRVMADRRAPGEYMEDDDFDSEEETQKKKPKKKSLRQIRHEEDLKMRGKWKEPGLPYNPEDRFKRLPNSDITFQAYYPRGHKPISGVHKVTVTHAESWNEIYLRSEREDVDVANVDAELTILYENKDVPSLPMNYVQAGNACVVKHEGVWYRCRIYTINERSGALLLHLSDIGRRLPPIYPEDYDRMKVLLPGRFIEISEKAYHSKIAVLCEFRSSRAERELLKEMLPVGTEVMADFDRKNYRVPWRVRLWKKRNGPLFSTEIEQELANRNMKSDLLDKRKQVTYWSNANAYASPVPPRTRCFTNSAIAQGNTPATGDARKPVVTFASDTAPIRPPTLPASVKANRALVDYEDTDSDRDSADSINVNSELQDEVVKTWIASDQKRIHHVGRAVAGLTLDEVKQQETKCIFDDEEQSISELCPHLALSDSEESADVVVIQE